MTTPFHLVIMGAPGAGKSTQSKLLQALYALRVYATGQMLRDEVALGTPLGNLAESYFEHGTLLPDTVMIDLITDRLAQLPPQQGCLFDGFPRTIPQARALDDLLHHEHRALNAAISLELTDDQAIQRLGGRRMCVGLGDPFPVHISDQAALDDCLRRGGQLVTRPDDEPAVIAERLHVYEAETAPLRDYYQQQGMLIPVSAAGTPQQVHTTIVAALQARITSTPYMPTK